MTVPVERLGPPTGPTPVYRQMLSTAAATANSLMLILGLSPVHSYANGA